MYQTLDIERPQVASSFSPVILGVISFAGAFFGTLLISSLSSPFTNQWVPNMQSVAATRVPFVAPVQRNEAVSRLEALQAIPLLAEPEPEEDPGADLEWLEDDVEESVVPADKQLNFAVFMATRIRLTRKGRHKRPFYRMVVADSKMPRDGRFLEVIGTYDPLKENQDPERVNLKVERILYWLGVGAQPSVTVAQLFEQAGLKLPPWLVKRLSQEKALRQVAIDKHKKEVAAAAKAAAGEGKGKKK
eukprot:EG_transcript_21843